MKWVYQFTTYFYTFYLILLQTAENETDLNLSFASLSLNNANDSGAVMSNTTTR